MVGYGLHAKDLSVILNQLNAMAVSYNVTNKEMLDGISRVSSLAQRAKLPLVELAGLIAAGVGATGRPGAEFGNAIKAVITSFNTPSKQKKLSDDYGIDVKTETDDLKDFGTVLSELYVRYQQLTGAQQASLLQVIGQRQQGARLAAMLDNYVASQVLAIRAQTDLNSAERENTNIRATMSSQLQTLRSEFERLSVNLVASGENITVSRGVQEVIKLLTNGMRVLSDHPTILSAIIALLVMMAAKLALVAVNMEQAEGKGNFFLNTVKQITLAVRTMGEAMEKANKEMAEAGGFFQMAGEKAEGATIGLLANVGSLASAWNTLKTVGSFVLATIASLAGQIIWFVIISAAIWAINKAFEYFQGAAQKATDQMAGLNDQIERSNNLGNAADADHREGGPESRRQGLREGGPWRGGDRLPGCGRRPEAAGAGG
jgi:TP901 family phage tail tape measure protein